ncbi:MAG: hypothetical protein ABI345_06230 [Jatrophihabitans sp.]
MLALLIVLIVTNVVTLGLLVWLYLQPIDLPHPDPAAASALDRSPRPAGLTGSGTRRMISVEILNPIELAGTRGRLAGIAGSLVPGLTRRIVYDQTLKILRRQLVEEHVIADVRLHTLRPIPGSKPDPRPSAKAGPAEPTATASPAGPLIAYSDEIEKVDLAKLDDDPAQR